MSHGDHKSHKAVVDLVKEYNKLNRNNVAIMLDTKGPEVRSGDVTEPIEMKPGMLTHYATSAQSTAPPGTPWSVISSIGRGVCSTPNNVLPACWQSSAVVV